MYGKKKWKKWNKIKKTKGGDIWNIYYLQWLKKLFFYKNEIKGIVAIENDYFYIFIIHKLIEII